MKLRDSNGVVSQLFAIDGDELRRRKTGAIGDYWQRALTFFMQVKDKRLYQLSTSQVSWLESIEEKTNDPG